jgi:hypothetical protein
VQWHVAVVVKLADRDPQPVGVADADHGVGLERSELARAHPGASEQLDRQSPSLVRVGCERGRHSADRRAAEHLGKVVHQT